MLALIAVAAIVCSQVESPAEHIQEIGYKLAPGRAEKIGRLIEHWSKKYDVEPEILTAILRQESNFESGIKACWIVHRYRTCQITCDYGIAQINELWIKKWGLDPDRLQNDDSYGIRIAARLLAILKREYGHEENWWGRYHSATPSKRSAYEERLHGFIAYATGSK